MTLQTYLDRRGITKYHLSKISGVPKTTILDICAGRSSIGRLQCKNSTAACESAGHFHGRDDVSFG